MMKLSALFFGLWALENFTLTLWVAQMLFRTCLDDRGEGKKFQSQDRKGTPTGRQQSWDWVWRPISAGWCPDPVLMQGHVGDPRKTAELQKKVKILMPKWFWSEPPQSGEALGLPLDRMHPYSNPPLLSKHYGKVWVTVHSGSLKNQSINQSSRVWPEFLKREIENTSTGG